MHPTLTAALPKLAAQIDTERPLIARAIAEHVTVDLQTEVFKIILHVSDAASHQLLSTQSQRDYLRQLFTDYGLVDYAIEITHTVPSVPSVPSVESVPSVPSVSAPVPTPRTPRLMLTLPQRAKLLTWVQQHSDRAATDPDSDLATAAATDLEFPLHSSHIRSVRTSLGIAKVKPEPTPSPIPSDLSLADLQSRLNAHEERLDSLAISATGTQATISALHDRLSQIIHWLDRMSYTTIPELPPLS